MPVEWRRQLARRELDVNYPTMVRDRGWPGRVKNERPSRDASQRVDVATKSARSATVLSPQRFAVTRMLSCAQG